MKVKLHIPTEQFGFCEVEIEGVAEETMATGAATIYRRISDAFKPQPINTLPDIDFRKVVDKVLLGDGNDVEDIERLSPQQAYAVKVLRNALVRLKNRQ